jgi:hypothetical protein
MKPRDYYFFIEKDDDGNLMVYIDTKKYYMENDCVNDSGYFDTEMRDLLDDIAGLVDESEHCFTTEKELSEKEIYNILVANGFTPKDKIDFSEEGLLSDEDDEDADDDGFDDFDDDNDDGFDGDLDKRIEETISVDDEEEEVLPTKAEAKPARTRKIVSKVDGVCGPCQFISFRKHYSNERIDGTTITDAKELMKVLNGNEIESILKEDGEPTPVCNAFKCDMKSVGGVIKSCDKCNKNYGRDYNGEELMNFDKSVVNFKKAILSMLEDDDEE